MQPTAPRIRIRHSLLCLALAGAGIAPAFAQDAGDRAEILRQIAQLRDQQARIAQMQRDNEEALRALEARLGLAPAQTPAPATPVPATPHAATTAAPTASAPLAASSATEPRLKISGDFRVRGQFDNSDDDGRNRSSSQVRGRLGATFAVNDRVTVGARLATGDSNDPNSTDVQLSNWVDDLEVSLDQAYLQLAFGQLKVFGGKMPQPFTRTELVWDGDVNPQGVAATWRHALGSGGAVRANALFFVVDEQAGGPDSTMIGAQLGYDTPALGPWRFDASAAYYDYTLDSMAGADAGDWRSNLLNPDGTYVSDFRLADLIVGATYTGLGERWPLRIVGDYVKNTAARTEGDTGYSIDLTLGRVSQVGDWRLSYGHAVAEVDAVLAAFSHDNIGIGTNYRMHSLGIDYMPWHRTTLSAILYRYRPDAAAYAGSNDPDDWLNRFRVSLMVAF
ncbi:putative porin [Pseudoxanthomonas putridarboris]|uniref:Porin n=1 Tax=Pseudoxanthomonas putridarboris TaxID=752605 RepID=A0ABU9IWL8_9GAMM